MFSCKIITSACRFLTKRIRNGREMLRHLQNIIHFHFIVSVSFQMHYLNGLAADNGEIRWHYKALNNEINTAMPLQPKYWPVKIQRSLAGALPRKYMMRKWWLAWKIVLIGEPCFFSVRGTNRDVISCKACAPASFRLMTAAGEYWVIVGVLIVFVCVSSPYHLNIL